MAIFEISDGALRPVNVTTFGAEGIYERRDIQSLLRDSIEVLGERLLVLAEEFGGWTDSSRRIDLLCLDSDANLVVVELKRTDDGGHMELQAIRYAAMVSAMTFQEAIEVYARHANRSRPDPDSARSTVLEFLGWEEADEDRFGQETRIILAAADFGKEVTTAVLWLAGHGVNIRCVRLKPYRLETGKVLLDIQQLIPLPEAASFQTQLGVKRQAERQQRVERHELRREFWGGLLALAQENNTAHAKRSPTDTTWIGGSAGRRGFDYNYGLRQYGMSVEVWISLGEGAESKAAFQAMKAQQADIEHAFGGQLSWDEQEDTKGSAIRYQLTGGYRSPREEWPTLQRQLFDAMERLDRATRRRIAELKF